jgi:hypothetical protein
MRYWRGIDCTGTNLASVRRIPTFYGVNDGPSLYFSPSSVFSSWEIYFVMLQHHVGEVRFDEEG